jgi:hypothetical protein
MAIPLTTPASLDFATLQQRIKEEESIVSVRLISLIGKEENSTSFNAHIYESVDDDTLPLSKLFIIPNDGAAKDNPIVKAWLELNPTQEIRCEEKVYISGSPTKIAVVR